MEHLDRHIQEARLRQHFHCDVAVAVGGALPLPPRLCPPARCPSAAWRGRSRLRYVIPSAADFAVRGPRVGPAMHHARESGGGAAPAACVHWSPHRNLRSVVPTAPALAIHIMSQHRGRDSKPESPRSRGDWKLEQEGSPQRSPGRPDGSAAASSERQAGCAAGNGCVLTGERVRGGRAGLSDVGIAWRLSDCKVVRLLPAQQVCAVNLCNKGNSNEKLAGQACAASHTKRL